MKRTGLPFYIFMLLIAAAVSRDSNGLPSLEAAPCLHCHDDTIFDELRKGHVHQPFRQKMCLRCHVSNEESEVSMPFDEHDFVLAGTGDMRIKWLSKNLQPTGTNWFVTPRQSISGDLFLGMGGGKQKDKIWLRLLSVPPWEEVRELEDDGQPPRISEVQVDSVQHGISASAVITWATDEYADSRIRYGAGELLSYSALDSQPTKAHKLCLTGLKTGCSYRFAVISRDLGGNETVSETFTLSTTEARESALPTPEQESNFDPELEYVCEFFKTGENYLLKVSSPRPVALFLGTNIDPLSAQFLACREPEEGHVALEDIYLTSVLQCFICHRDYKGYISHPVGVLPKDGMVIPPEYPTLPDGRISCISCHAHHASEFPYMTIKPSEKELCIGCHKDQA